jgi:hypothetical protein
VWVRLSCSLPPRPTMSEDSVRSLTRTIFTSLIWHLLSTYVQIDSIPIWLSWLEVFSFFQYAFVGLLRVQFEGQKFSCQQSNLCLATGEAVLADMGVDGDDRNFWYEFGKVMALTVFFRTAAYFSLRFLHRKTLRFE